jgi:hypothetical protein
MTILLILSAFFAWLTLREFWVNRNKENRFNLFNIFYLGTLITITILLASQPYKYWKFEKLMAQKSSVLADNKQVNFHCNSVVDSVFDNDLGVAGHANPKTGEIVFQNTRCEDLMNYIDHPESVTQREIISLHIFTHESMHIRGELDEKKTDCQSIQRNYLAAKLLGIPDEIARNNALVFYKTVYLKHPYRSPLCIKGGKYDEDLDDFIWG